MSCSVIHCIMEKSGSGSAMKSNSLFSKNVLSLVLVIGCPPYVCFSNIILELPMTFFNYQIANFILHYRPIGDTKNIGNLILCVTLHLQNSCLQHTILHEGFPFSLLWRFGYHHSSNWKPLFASLNRKNYTG